MDADEYDFCYRLERELVKVLDRGDEAIATAWTEFADHPSDCKYQTLMGLPMPLPGGRRTGTLSSITSALNMVASTASWRVSSGLPPVAPPTSRSLLSWNVPRVDGRWPTA